MMAIKGVELFAGAGGLLLGSALAGVKHVAAVEWNKWACQTMRANADAGYPLVRGLRVIEDDVRNVNWDEVTNGADIDVVTGGPPCQPFSLGGLARNADDPRDMFPATTAVIEKLRPRAFVIENVKGLTRTSFSDYFEYIKLRLSHPELHAREGESWREHYTRLQKEHTSIRSDLQYTLITTLVDAADYGVPQRRHRVIMVGFRQDVEADWTFPVATHSKAALVRSQVRGDYWERFGIPVPSNYQAPVRLPEDDGLRPWVTVRQALHDMPIPCQGHSTPGWLDHRLQEGARSYKGHTGSPLDEPSKALKAGVHGVPGGENMMRFANGSVRYYSTREAARIQTFPDRYALHGAWTETLRQLGNAVPVHLAQTVMLSVSEHLAQDTAMRQMQQVAIQQCLRVVG